MRRSTKLKLGSGLFAVVVAVAAFAILPSVGAAAGPSQSSLPTTSTPWDPQTTNVPYLAWAGEQIRLEKCIFADSDPQMSALAADTDTSGLSLDVLVEDWSGDPNNKPQVEPSTVKLFVASTSEGFALCGMADVVSLYPGMARIEGDVVVNGSDGWLGYGPAETVIKHQFLAGWMTLNDPTLTELSASSFPSTAQAEAAQELGDPSGDGEFAAGGSPGSSGTPGSDTGYLDVKVTGSMPMEGAWATLLGTSSVTLPDDWATLANALATDDNPSDTQAEAADKWDISNDPNGDFGQVPQTPACGAPGPETVGAPAAPAGTDSVDDCTGGGPNGPFSTQFGELSSSTAIGPFDPVRAADTLLPNGVLDSSDAPMPAARVDVTIAPNSGSASDTSGVGYLAPADKTKTYSRDFLGFDGLNDNEYAPFYNQYIPATAADAADGGVSSGVDGGYANNFNGFLVDGVYHNWDFAAQLASNTAAPTMCLREAADNDPQSDSPTANPGDYYDTPSGDTSVSVYTDNHGEAQVQYVPGEGFYFNSLINNGSAVLNADGGCDLQSLYDVPDGLGTATITATARYPFKPVDFPDMTSAPITKSVMSLWSKTLAYFPKGTGTANGNSRIVVAHAQGIDGTPFAGEIVCFSSDAEAMTWFNGTVDGINLSGTSPASDPKGPSLGRVCVTTDGNGNAAVEVLESNPVAINVIADFTAEGILRSISVDYSTPGSSGGTPPPNAGGGSVSSTGGTTPPSTAVLQQVAPGLVATTPPAVAGVKTRITLVRLLSPVHGRHYVLIRVASGSRTVTVQLRLVVRNHLAGRSQTVRETRTITVRSNRLVKVAVSNSVIRVAGASLR
jgi:hypothetical protein